MKLKRLSEQATRILRALDVLTTAAGFEDPLTADNRLAIRNAEAEMILGQREVLRIAAFWETHDIKFPLKLLDPTITPEPIGLPEDEKEHEEDGSTH